MSFEEIFNNVRRAFYEDFTLAGLKTVIVLWALFVIFLTLFVINNKWILAAVLAYEVLP